MSDVKEKRVVVKEVPHAKLYSDGTIFVGPVRASYPHVFSAYKGKDSQTGKFGIVGLMPKTKEYFPAKDLIRDEIKRYVKDKNKGKDLAPDKKFLRDGDLSDKELYEGHFEIHASEVRKPQVRDSVRDPKTKKLKVLKAGDDDDRIYGGCWVNMLINPWFQNNEFGKRVNAGLVAVMFVQDDEAFGEGRISEEAIDETFDEFAEEGSGFDDDDLGEESDL